MPSTAVAVLFDLDGVLIDSADHHLAGWQALGRELGYSLPASRFLESFGLRNDEAIPMLFGAGRGADEVAALGERKESLYRKAARGRIAAMRGAVELVHACGGAGMRLAVASSGPRENVVMALEELGVYEVMGAVVAAEDVSRGKPDPMVFATAARRLDICPACCVVIEDAPAGVAAGKAAGMIVVGVTSGHPAERLGSADLVVGGLDKLSPARLFDLCADGGTSPR